LTNACPTLDAKFYAASQVIDEARHVEVFAKFLQRKVGTIYPIGGTLKALLDTLLAAPTWKTKTLGMQTLFEGMAVGIFDMIQKGCTNPLLSDIIRRVKQDEARHAAFGILTMRRTVREATADEMAAMEDFSFNVLETFNANQQLDMLRDLAPRYGLDPDTVVQVLLTPQPESHALVNPDARANSSATARAGRPHRLGRVSIFSNALTQPSSLRHKAADFSSHRNDEHLRLLRGIRAFCLANTLTCA